MASMDEQILRAAKEIVVKFIETGRVSPTAFPDAFRSIYAAVADAVKDHTGQREEADRPSKSKSKK